VVDGPFRLPPEVREALIRAEGQLLRGGNPRRSRPSRDQPTVLLVEVEFRPPDGREAVGCLARLAPQPIGEERTDDRNRQHHGANEEQKHEGRRRPSGAVRLWGNQGVPAAALKLVARNASGGVDLPLALWAVDEHAVRIPRLTLLARLRAREGADLASSKTASCRPAVVVDRMVRDGHGRAELAPVIDHAFEQARHLCGDADGRHFR